MHSDNMAISGQTTDYGPCAFMRVDEPKTVFGSIDRTGRYGNENQPGIAQWNWARIAEAILPLLDQDQVQVVPGATHVLEDHAAVFERY